MFRTIPLVLCLVAVSHQLNFVKFSVPKAVEAGTEAELTCEHDGDKTVSITKWFWKPFGDETYQLYQHNSISHSPPQVILPHGEPAWNITLKAEGEHNLILWDLQPGHSGTFECAVEEEKGDFKERRNSSDMVVFNLGTGPELTFEGDEEVLITCAASGVAPEPEQISISYDSTTFNTTIKDGPTDGLYNITTNATLPRQDIEGKDISCKLSFIDSDIELPSELMKVSILYHSDAWYATTTAAPDDDEAPATPQAELLIPDSAGRVGGAWAALAALAVPLHLWALL